MIASIIQGDDGFSSQEEPRHQELHFQEHKNDIIETSIKEQIKFKIPPPSQIKQKPYNLYPDTVTGWSPKILLPSPIPIIFDNQTFDIFIKYVHKVSNPNAKLCYLGPRYQNSYYSWFNKQFHFPYGHIKAPPQIKYSNRFFCGNSRSISQQSLMFNSFFESANLDCVIQVGTYEYELFMRVDSNTQGHLQWFNFTVNNMRKMAKYKFHICNLQKSKTLFSRGMKPYILSKKKLEIQKIGWQQSGENLHYERKTLKSVLALNYNLCKCFKLSFQYCTEYQNDEIQISYCVPYTYSYLCNFLQQIGQKCQKKGFVKMSKLCTSLGGLEVPLLIIHEKSTNQKKQTQSSSPKRQNADRFKSQIMKKCIIISARAHPGESNASYMMHGFIQFICGDSKSAQNLRKSIIFKIIPMLNPDGVALGNYRTGLSGKDFNRQFRNPDSVIFPQVHAIKNLVYENKQIFKENLLMFLDFHGHSIKKNVFMYGPQFPIIDRNYYQSRIFPKLLGNRTEMFRYYSCIFKVSEFKETTARAVLLRKLNIPMTFTIEASNGSYYDHQKLKDIPFTDLAWKKMGSIIGETIEEYFNLIVVAQTIRIQKNLARQKYKKECKHLHRSILRKNTKRQQHLLNRQNQKELLILPGIQDQKIRMLLEEIKSAQEQKPLSKVSDDELSEGSSDQQGKEDDLSPNKVNFLYKIIKNKKSKMLSKCKFAEEKEKQPRFATNQDSNIRDDKNSQDEEDNQSNNRSNNFIRRDKPGRRSFMEDKNNKIDGIFKGELLKEKKTAKILNFSFGSAVPVREPSAQEKQMARNKMGMLEACLSSKIEDKKRNQIITNRVIDLGEYSSLRKTYTHIVRQKLDNNIDNKLETIFIGKNSRRVQEYKLRKINLKNIKN